MPEPTSNQPEPLENRELREQQKILLAREMFESRETFPFPGIRDEAYAGIKAANETHPGITTPIDELIERCESQGIKVVFGPHPESGNVFILPAESDDIDSDALFPRHLQMDAVTRDNLRTLILLDKGQG